ncbi:MAG: AI-2E family transporter [Firmicutes bacterium]|nr:AI-2E family transporter [Bacillota bacterium]
MDGIKGIIIAPLLLAVVVAYLLCPIVDYLEKQKLSRSAAIGIIYLFFAALLLLLCLNGLPSLLEELEQLASVLPEYTEKFMSTLSRIENFLERYNLPEGIHNTLDENIEQLQSSLVINLEELSQFLMAFFRQTFALLLVPLFAFYLLRDNALLKIRLLQVVPRQYRSLTEDTIREIDLTLGAYLRGIFIICSSVGVMMYLGLLLIGVQFAIFFGIIFALTDFIPYFGPLIGAVPLLAVTLLHSPGLFWKALILIVIVQQIENQLITPQVLSRSLHFHPLTVIIALLLGGIYLGFWGLILAVPLTAILRILFRQFLPIALRFFKKGRKEKDNL